MCSISGVYIKNRSDENILFRLTRIIIRSEERGRDSFGVACLGNNIFENKFIDRPSHIKRFFPEQLGNYNIIINNNRAEPTTEFVKEKKLSDIQPFCNKKKTIFIAHNGTIANDKELEQEYGLKRDTKIDSAIVPVLLEKIWDGKTAEHLQDILINKLIGSYAISIWDKRSTNTLWLATNYKPLFLMFKNGNIYFTSLEQFFKYDKFNEYEKVIEVKPYTLLKINDSCIKEYTLYAKDLLPDGKKKALIVCSSGLDSTVCASWAKKQGYDITLLHFKYKCRAENAEGRAINNIKDFFNCDLVEIPINFFKDTIKHSRLLNEEESLMKDRGGEKSAELAYEWVPARNLIFLSIAAGYAEANKFDYIILGGNLEESGCILNDKNNKVRMWDETGKKKSWQLLKMPADIKLNDELMSWNEKEKKLEKTIVKEIYTPKFNKYLRIICEGRKFKNRKEEEVVFTVSEDHPFFIKNKQKVNQKSSFQFAKYVMAKNLKIGDTLIRHFECKHHDIQSNIETNNGAFKNSGSKGNKNFWYGHTRKKDTICPKCGIIHWQNNEQIKETMNVLYKDENYIKKISDGVKKYINNRTEEEVIYQKKRTSEGILEAMKEFEKETGYKHWNSTPERKKFNSDLQKRLIDEGKSNPANRTARPTRIEKIFIEYFSKYNLPFSYKGDGQIWITSEGKRLNPDFVNLENKKIIEVSTSDFPFHTSNEINNRLRLYNNVNWDMLFLTEKDLVDELLLKEQIELFLGGIRNGLKIKNIEIIEEEVQTYNYHCEPNNNFFIGNSGALVHNSYADNEFIFQKKFNDILPNALNLQNKIELKMPVAGLMKHEIVKLGLEIGAPLHLTWSCYEDGKIPCGECGPDYMRKIGFKMNGVKDPQEYKVTEDGFWDDCKEVKLIDNNWK